MNLLTKIGIGSVQFGLPYGISNKFGQTSKDEVSKILNTASDYGVNTIDTASSYGNSEIILGRNQLDRFQIISKFMPSINGISVKNQFNSSLNSLNVDRLHGYLAHRPLELISNKNDWFEIQELKSKGKINKIGFSLNSPNEYYQLKEAEIYPDIVQVPFNYFDTRFKEILIELKSNDCENHSRSTFLQGLFFVDINQLSNFFEPFFNELKFLQENYSSNLGGTLLKYVLEQPYIDKVILGLENANQLEENIKGLEVADSLDSLLNYFPEEKLMPMNWPKK